MTDFIAPKKVLIKTDDSELLFVSIQKGSYTYQYINSCKAGLSVTWVEDYLVKMLQYSFRVLEENTIAPVEQIKPVAKIKFIKWETAIGLAPKTIPDNTLF